MRSMAGHDPKDTTFGRSCLPDYEAAIGKSVKGMKIGIPKEYRLDGMPAEIENSGREGAALAEGGRRELVDVSLPHTQYALPAYYIVAPAEASSNLARYDGVRYGLRVPGRNIERVCTRAPAPRALATKSPPRHDRHLRALGRLLQRRLHPRETRHVDQEDFRGWLSPEGITRDPDAATPSAAFGVGEKGADPVEMYLNDIFTVTVNMAGFPASPCRPERTRKVLPLGLQLIGRPFDEETLFSLGEVVETGGRPLHAAALVVVWRISAPA